MIPTGDNRDQTAMNREDFYRRPPNIKTRLGAGGVVARRSASQILICLLRDDIDHQYILPKGGVEKGETLEQAARREIAEEAGLSSLTLLANLGTEQRLNSRKNRWQTTHYFLFSTQQVTGKPSGSENWHLDWFDLENLPEMFWPGQKQIIQSNRDLIRAKILPDNPTPH